MAMQGHLDTLKSRHQVLDQQIEYEEQRPLPDQVQLAMMKKKKLQLKEKMSRIVS